MSGKPAASSFDREQEGKAELSRKRRVMARKQPRRENHSTRTPQRRWSACMKSALAAHRLEKATFLTSNRRLTILPHLHVADQSHSASLHSRRECGPLSYLSHP